MPPLIIDRTLLNQGLQFVEEALRESERSMKGKSLEGRRR
jgi:hypothetical protein